MWSTCCSQGDMWFWDYIHGRAPKTLGFRLQDNHLYPDDVQYCFSFYFITLFKPKHYITLLKPCKIFLLPLELYTSCILVNPGKKSRKKKKGEKEKKWLNEQSKYFLKCIFLPCCACKRGLQLLLHKCHDAQAVFGTFNRSSTVC